MFIVVARVINGLTWGLENVGVNTYFRRLSPRTLLGSSFGFIDTWSNFGWIVAAVIGMVLAPHIPTHILLLAVIPTSIIALLVARRVPKDRVRTTKKPRPSLLASYRLLAKEWRHWNKNLWLLSVLVLFTGIIQALMWFFIPIDAYVEGAKPAMVILLSIIAVIPSLFGYTFGKLSDHKNKYVLLAAGLVGVAGVAIGLAVFPAYGFKLIASFLFGVLLELFFVVQQSLVTTLGSSKAYGERGGAFESVATIGDLIGPLVLGFSLDKLGFGNVAICVAVVAVALSSLFLALKHGIVSRA
jgi:MFS family permease